MPLCLPESYSFSLPCFVGRTLCSQFTSIPGTVFKGSKGEQREVSLSANNRKRTLFESGSLFQPCLLLNQQITGLRVRSSTR